GLDDRQVGVGGNDHLRTGGRHLGHRLRAQYRACPHDRRSIQPDAYSANTFERRRTVQGNLEDTEPTFVEHVGHGLRLVGPDPPEYGNERAFSDRTIPAIHVSTPSLAALATLARPRAQAAVPSWVRTSVTPA